MVPAAATAFAVLVGMGLCHCRCSSRRLDILCRLFSVLVLCTDNTQRFSLDFKQGTSAGLALFSSILPPFRRHSAIISSSFREGMVHRQVI